MKQTTFHILFVIILSAIVIQDSNATHDPQVDTINLENITDGQWIDAILFPDTLTITLDQPLGNILFSLDQFYLRSPDGLQEQDYAGVRIEGKLGSQVIAPFIGTNDLNGSTYVEGNTIWFQSFQEELPIYFDHPVGEIEVELIPAQASNAYVKVHVGGFGNSNSNMVHNPDHNPCEIESILLAVDHSF
jgi:hypothetical protein